MKEDPCIYCIDSDEGRPCGQPCQERIEYESELSWWEHDNLDVDMVGAD